MHLLIASTLFVVGGIAPVLRAQPVDSAEASIRILKRAATTQRDGSHLQLLFALRQLHDPDLRPFFERLVKTNAWQIQVHAALGLAETSNDLRLDPKIMAEVAPQAQDAIIATALDLKLLAPEQLAEFLRVDALSPMARLVLLAELVAPEDPKDSARSAAPNRLSNDDIAAQLKALLNSEDLHIPGLSSCLLAQLGDVSALGTLQSRIDALEKDSANGLRIWVMDAIRRYRLRACLPWLIEQIERSHDDAEFAYRGVYAVLSLDPSKGVPLWARTLGPKPDYPQRVRFCIALLTVGDEVPDSAFDQLKPAADEDLLMKMVAEGKAMANHQDESGPLIDLLDLQNALTTDWAMQRALKLPKVQAARVYSHLIDRVRDAHDEDGDAIAVAVTASARLADLDPDETLSRLREAQDDSLMQQAILLGLFESKSEGIGDAASSIKRIGSGRADSLALLLTAKYAKTLTASDVEQLGKIAAGGGRVSEILQAQAAWFYLKKTGRIDQALAQIFHDKSPAGS